MPRTRVLVADDESSIRLVTRVNLEARGYEVIEACDGREALHQLLHARPDVALLDIMMPHMTGLEVAERFFDACDGATVTAIVFVSALVGKAERIRGHACGALGFVAKPFELTMLEQTVAEVLTILREGRQDELRRKRLSELRSGR